MTETLKFYKLHPDVKAPEFATEGSACFDIRSFIPNDTTISLYDPWGDFYTLTVTQQDPLVLEEGHRALIPTGIVFDIPAGYSIRLHARSGNALKRGLVLVNSEGIIDNDYVEPSFIMMTNSGSINQTITDGERLCQAELVEKLKYHLVQTHDKPQKKTSRDGGFGSTGK